jgi:hypothetical protein
LDHKINLTASGEKTVPFCATWKGIFSHHPYSSLPQTLRRERAHLCNVDGHLLPPPPSCREWVRLCNVDQPHLSNPPPRRECARLCSVDRHLLTSLSPLLILSPPDTPGGRFIRRGNRLPSTRDSPASRDLCRALRPAVCVSPDAPRPASCLTPGVVFIPAILPPTSPPLTLHNT